MLAVSLSTLREKIRERYDLPTFSTTSFVTTSLINEMTNEAVESLYMILMESRPDEYCTYEETISVSANATTFDTSTLTAASFVDMRRLYWLRSANDPVVVEAGTIDDFHQRSEAATSWDLRPKYYLMRDLLYWLPVPNAARSLRIVYVGLPTALAADGDTVKLQPGWDQWLVYDVCAKIALKEEGDPSTWIALRDRVGLPAQRERNKGVAKGDARQARDRRGARTTSRWRNWGFS